LTRRRCGNPLFSLDDRNRRTKSPRQGSFHRRAGHATSAATLRGLARLPLKHTWYAIALPIRYEGPSAGSVKGCGRTLAINTRKVRFASVQDLPVGLDVLLRISWPAQLPDGTGLSLSIFGRVERSVSNEVEVTVSRHEFRTRRSGEPSERLGDVRAMHAS